MLAASGETRFGTATVRSTVLLERRFWVFGVARTGLVYDTRFVPGAEGESSKTIAYILLRGSFEVLAPVRQRFDAPSAFLLEQDQHEGSLGRRAFLYRAFGDPYVAIEVRVDREDVCFGVAPRPASITLDGRAWSAARRMSMFHEGWDDSAVLSDFVGGLVRSQIVSPRIASSITRDDHQFSGLWTALSPLLERHCGLPTVQEVAAETGLSLRQTARQLAAFFNAFRHVGSGWRSLTRRSRLKLAVLGLSALDTSVSEVARATGYGGSEALGRAFRDAGLPAPSAIRAALLAREF